MATKYWGILVLLLIVVIIVLGVVLDNCQKNCGKKSSLQGRPGAERMRPRAAGA